MNEFEDKLRGLPFRDPPADLRQCVLAAAEPKVGGAQPWTWRDWLWPAPLAWAGLAILLVAALTTGALIGVGVAPGRNTMTTAVDAASPTLFAFQPRGRQVALLESLH